MLNRLIFGFSPLIAFAGLYLVDRMTFAKIALIPLMLIGAV